MHEPDSTNIADSPEDVPNQHRPVGIRLKIPPVSSMPRRSTRLTPASGSEYHTSEKSVHSPQVVEEEEEIIEQFGQTRSGRRIKKRTYMESSEGEEDQRESAADLFNAENDHKVAKGHPKRTRQRLVEEQVYVRRSTRGKAHHMDGFIDQDEEDEDAEGTYGLRPKKSAVARSNGTSTSRKKNSKQPPPRPPNLLSRTRSSRGAQDAEDDFQPHTSSPASGSADGEGSMDDAPGSSDLEMPPEPEPEPEPEEDEADDGKPYLLRQRQPVNYAIPPPLEDMPLPKKAQGRNTRSGHGAASKKRGLGWSASGAELGRWMGMPADDSDSDHPTRTPRKPYGGLGPFGTGAVAAGGMLPGEFAAGTPSNLGKIGDSALADADPLGVNQNVTFDEVGGLDDHIHALKEMTLLPLLYPEVFQRFNVTPPRGVLFHGPPGTGKTLLARALAASCRSGGRQISFFMRKGADCLSKWVGEAERQLRLLFEEARNCQPSIIFFDEIDGLAPVRSSKQDQIHASIVSTLLALMDGMDGRGQVIVIGATNRPDAVDPALRRPGRFDREFYFGLPGLEAREKILSIMTRKWHGWGGAEEDKSEERANGVKERIKGLAKLTKGYGGADLRALCTESALNAIQRRYPQVYKSSDRLLLKPETIGVGLRDFMISIKKLVPSSARSSASAASPLPSQFQPLLGHVLEKVKEAIQRVLPLEKKLSALEEAEFEDIGGEEGALEREMLSQAMQTLRVYRPRIAIHGGVGMGQEYIGAAALHHLEGYHIQSLELGTLMGDSTRTVEAAIVQVFVEAKRHQPSVLYIPSLIAWCATISETSRSTVRAMLDTLAPTDPILLLAVVDGQFSELPRDVKAWFGSTQDNRITLVKPTASQREEFFEALLKDIQRPPNQFSDGVQRKKRVLEVLPIAPPPEPRKPTAVELALQEENDQKVITLLKYRLGPILTELKRKFKRFTKRAAEDYNIDPQDSNMNGLDTFATTIIETHENLNGLAMDLTNNDQAPQLVNGENGPQPNGHVMEQQQVQRSLTLYDMDLERMQSELWKGRYLTPQDFMDDVGKIVHNADVRFYEDSDRLYKAQAMFTAAQVSIQEFDPQFRLECERMAARERQRRAERRKEKEKDKGKEPAALMVTRRSARANGLQPEHPITDPVKLERRLKRQRGEIDGNGGDSHTSEGETHGLPVDDSRDVKRSRILDDHDDRDPLDTLNETPGSEARTHVVRFVTAPIEPMAPLITVAEHHQTQHETHRPPFPSPLQNESMPVDSMPVRPFGFNPALLNPMMPSEDPFSVRSSVAPVEPPAMIIDPSDPFTSQPHPHHPYFGPFSPNASTSYPPIAPRGSTPLASVSVQPSPAQSRRTSRQPTPLPGPPTSTTGAAPPPEPVPMEIERTPTPLPDFHVSSTLVDGLRRYLRDLTAELTIEQLEQLRATSLGTVWRRRKEWDRDELVSELLKEAKSFINGVLEATNSEDYH